MSNTTDIPILQTKLHQPSIPEGHVHRSRLLERLEKGRQRPLTLVSASAGYGKSTLVSCWLETVDCPSAWVSLDENENDLRQFLAYFLAAVNMLFPEACKETRTLLNADHLAPLRSLVITLVMTWAESNSLLFWCWMIITSYKKHRFTMYSLKF